MEQMFAFGACQARRRFEAVCHVKTREQMPGKEGRKDSVEEPEQWKTSQQLVLPAPGGYNEGTPTSLAGLDLIRIRGAHGECGGAGDLGAANDRKRTLLDEWSLEEGKKGETAGERAQELLKEQARVETLIPLKETARVRIQEP